MATLRRVSFHDMQSAFSLALSIFLLILVNPAFTQNLTLANFDHLAHSIPGIDQTLRDDDGDGFASVTLNGELSHTHFFIPGPPAVSGKLVSYEWRENSLGSVIGTSMTVVYDFPVGETVVTLTVVDNSGDVASNNVTVTVLPSGDQGAYMYFYDLSRSAAGHDEVPFIPPPSWGQAVDAITFNTLDSFPKIPFLTEGPFAARTKADYLAVLDGEYAFFVVHGGGTVELFIDGQKRLGNMKTVKKEKLSATKPFFLKKGKHKLDLIYYTPDPMMAQLLLGVNLNGGVQAVTNYFLSYESNIIVPTLHKITPEKATLDGGGYMKLQGAGFTKDTQVFVGPYKADPVYVKSSSLIETQVPKADANADVLVQVKTLRGESNSQHFSYTKAAAMPIKFKETYVKYANGSNFPSQQFTSVVVGPDLRYYFGSLDTHVHVLTLSHSTLVVQTSCKSRSVGNSRSITAVSFDPGDREIRVYISTNTFYWKNWKIFSDEEGWHNGKIETLVPGIDIEDTNVCLVHEKDVVTGLPVSNHDHGVNSLVWDNDGNLYAQVGGTTNAGYSEPDDLVGGVPESVLSAATVLIHLRTPGFDGHIKYDQYVDPANAKKLTSDKFIEGFGFGFRNSYGSVFHSNGQIYATDNGPNEGYGKKSVTCDTEGDDPWHPDSLVLVRRNSYFGFPNRARGSAGDARQCTYHSPTETSRNGFTAALATFDASTNGLIEYTANTFEGQMKGDLLASKYAVGGRGKLYRIPLDAAGAKVRSGVSELAMYSALSIAMNPFGSLIMPRVQQANIAVLVPDEGGYEGNGPGITAVLPNRGPKSGGNQVSVTGYNIVEGAKVYFGDKLSKVVRRSFNENWILCKVPAGEGSVQVVIETTHGQTKTIHSDYHYLNY